MKRLLALAALLLALSIAIAAQPGEVVGAGGSRPDVPRHLSDTGLYAMGTLTVAVTNRPFSPQYPLWTDGARKSRWIYLPPGTTIDTTDIDAWKFPVGTRFWKEFEFGGRRVETRMLWRKRDGGWAFASYVWNEAQTDAELAPAQGIPAVAEVASGKRHSIPSVEDCRNCHVTDRVEALGFTALQLSTDRDPLAPHADALTGDMLTTKTLVEQRLLTPARPELVASPPRIHADDPVTRAVLGTLSANCGNCHNAQSSIASLGLLLRQPAYGSRDQVEDDVRRLLGRTSKWQVPHTTPEKSVYISPGAPDLSGLLLRMRSRRPSTQMPPLGTVIADQSSVDLVTGWIREMSTGPTPGRGLAGAHTR